MNQSRLVLASSISNAFKNYYVIKRKHQNSHGLKNLMIIRMIINNKWNDFDKQKND